MLTKKSFNNLSFAQAERLAFLLEEMGEAQQAIGKILRHGYNSNWQDGPENYETLEKELGHVLAAIAMLTGEGHLLSCDISISQILEQKRKKLNIYAKGTFTHHQG